MFLSTSPSSQSDTDGCVYGRHTLGFSSSLRGSIFLKCLTTCMNAFQLALSGDNWTNMAAEYFQHRRFMSTMNISGDSACWLRGGSVPELFKYVLIQSLPPGMREGRAWPVSTERLELAEKVVKEEWSLKRRVTQAVEQVAEQDLFHSETTLETDHSPHWNTAASQRWCSTITAIIITMTSMGRNWEQKKNKSMTSLLGLII